MAHLLTAVRLVLALPIAFAFARADFLDPSLLLVLLCLAITTDYLDGKVARLTHTASAKGQLFDHLTDCIFVTAGLTGTAMAGLLTPILPILIAIAFSQYALDSYFLHRQRQLRMSTLGRWNGILYFAPLLLISASRLSVVEPLAAFLTATARVVAYALVVATLISVADRASTS